MPDDDKRPKTRPAKQSETPREPAIEPGERDPDAPIAGANPGQRLTGNKNTEPGGDREPAPEQAKNPAVHDRPTRDDGDNDDLGELGSDRPGHAPR